MTEFREEVINEAIRVTKLKEKLPSLDQLAQSIGVTRQRLHVIVAGRIRKEEKQLTKKGTRSNECPIPSSPTEADANCSTGIVPASMTKNNQ